MKISAGVMLIAVTLAFNVEAQPVFDPAEFAAARAQANADNAKDKEGDGCYMDCEFDPYFGTRFHDIMGACFKQLESPVVKTFTAVLRLDDEGRVQSAWLDLDTNLSRCAIAAIKPIKFPNPPFAPFRAWITVNVE